MHPICWLHKETVRIASYHLLAINLYTLSIFVYHWYKSNKACRYLRTTVYLEQKFRYFDSNYGASSNTSFRKARAILRGDRIAESPSTVPWPLQSVSHSRQSLIPWHRRIICHNGSKPRQDLGACASEQASKRATDSNRDNDGNANPAVPASWIVEASTHSWDHIHLQPHGFCSVDCQLFIRVNIHTSGAVWTS